MNDFAVAAKFDIDVPPEKCTVHSRKAGFPLGPGFGRIANPNTNVNRTKISVNMTIAQHRENACQPSLPVPIGEGSNGALEDLSNFSIPSLSAMNSKAREGDLCVVALNTEMRNNCSRLIHSYYGKARPSLSAT